jgi:extracellular factor (EF) 3-hydroxypalmitic acid methyl ester biosynthesis protein
LNLTRHAVALEVYNPYSIVQLSEVLDDLRILRRGTAIYQGRAVVTTLVPTGAVTIVSATLVDPWSDLSGLFGSDEIRAETERFIDTWATGSRLRPGYQLAVNNLASFLQELSRWLGQAETLYTAEMVGSRGQSLFEEVWPPLEIKLRELFERFEEEARAVPPDEVPTHKTFAQRELHPLLMCDPFIHRSFTKPLGYAGDYQMVNMILGGEPSRVSTYARVVSYFNLTRAPAVAHRNRVVHLEQLLRQEARRKKSRGERLRVLNVGCGPATEVERFLATGAEAEGALLTLVDFNEETLEYAKERIADARRGSSFDVDITTVHQSIHELLKAAASGESSLASQYDFVYCAGLFDYLSERVCKRLVRLFYEWTAPGGLSVTTNVHASNPIRYYMAHVAEWYLEYRDEQQFRRFAAPALGGDVLTDSTGVNLFLELRRPDA